MPAPIELYATSTLLNIKTMKNMTYKGYAASIEYSDDEYFISHIAGIKDRVRFHDESVIELKNAFHEAVDDYLETIHKSHTQEN